MGKTEIKSILFSRVLPFVVVPLIVFVLYQLSIVVYKGISTDKDISELQKQVDELEKSQRHLREFNTFLNSDFFAEKEARIKLGMQKQDERVIVLPKAERLLGVSAKPTPVDKGSSNGQSEEQKSNPQLWWEYFFGG